MTKYVIQTASNNMFSVSKIRPYQFTKIKYIIMPYNNNTKVLKLYTFKNTHYNSFL